MQRIPEDAVATENKRLAKSVLVLNI